MLKAKAPRDAPTHPLAPSRRVILPLLRERVRFSGRNGKSVFLPMVFSAWNSSANFLMPLIRASPLDQGKFNLVAEAVSGGCTCQTSEAGARRLTEGQIGRTDRQGEQCHHDQREKRADLYFSYPSLLATRRCLHTYIHTSPRRGLKGEGPQED